MKRVFTLLLAVVSLLPTVPLARAEFPYPTPPAGVPPTAYADYAFLSHGMLPNEYNGSGDRWKYDSGPSGFPEVDSSPFELNGTTGMSVDLAWRATTGRPDVVIAVLDSGIEWDDREIANKVYLNPGELPLPQGCRVYDCDGNGVFDVRDYAHDTRVTDSNHNGFLDPEDLIAAFTCYDRANDSVGVADWSSGSLSCSNGAENVDNDGNGYRHDIAGWDALDDRPDPVDDVRFGHGTGEASDSTGEANNGIGFIGACPNCRILPIRVGESFVAHENDFAKGVFFALTTHARVIQEALGTIDATSFAQSALDAAWNAGVPVIASAADEESYHHNFPAAQDHTIVVNSVTRGDPLILAPRSALFLNGCTNFGGNIAVAVSSGSCSSEATGRGAGIAGLIVSAGLNEIDRGHLTRPLTAVEVRELMETTANDIDFHLDRTVVSPVPTVRFPSGPGWDPYFGYGRLNASAAVARVASGAIPPEAEITSPSWFSVSDPRDSPAMAIDGLAAADRSTAVSWTLEYGCGATPEDWVTIAEGEHAVRSARLGTLHADDAYEHCGFPLVVKPTASDFTITLRLRVRDASGHSGEHRKQIFLVEDPTALRGFPRHIGGSGEASVRVADLNGDGRDELVFSTSDGLVHALDANGVELDGWPVHTAPLAGTHGHGPVFESIPAGGVAIADVDGRGALSVAACTQSGSCYLWDAHGHLRDGFPVHTNPAYSQPAIRDPFNVLLPGIVASPVLADLDGDGTRELIAASLDRHVYAWHADGSNVTGFPRLVIDRSKVASIDPFTDRIVPRDPATTLRGSYILSTPAIADLDGDGRPELILGTNEEYAETPNWSAASAIVASAVPATGLIHPGNGRLHALELAGGEAPGFPVAIGLFDTEILPYVGEGIPGSAAIADVDGDGKPEIAIFSVAGPAYLLNADGTSALGNGPDGRPNVFASDGPRASVALDVPTLPALGQGAFADLTGTRLAPLAYVAPTLGLGRALDIALDEEQLVSEDHLTAWNTKTGSFLPGFPARMEDLQFLTDPAVVNVDATPAPEILEGSGGYLLHAWTALGTDAPGWPKFTGNWLIGTAASGDLLGDGGREVAVLSREGNLFVWKTTATDASSSEWWTEHHDTANTGNYATPPLRAPHEATLPPPTLAFAPVLAGLVIAWRRRA
ncbi:MAG: S8 family serine peptidase [Thermoplasmatota archaeon]